LRVKQKEVEQLKQQIALLDNLDLPPPQSSEEGLSSPAQNLKLNVILQSEISIKNFEGVQAVGSGSEDEDYDCDLSERDIGEDIMINPIELDEADKVGFLYKQTVQK